MLQFHQGTIPLGCKPTESLVQKRNLRKARLGTRTKDNFQPCQKWKQCTQDN